ncbi:MAG: methionine adenosyltransferase [Desulfobacteraceae bacterium]|nr:MAG: methionine adenosyltransferase [Desulfobacteraceae bacterium]
MISVEALKSKAIKEHTVEIVERKGKGHPDYICDSIMDAISVALCERYREEFGTILHHNIDKGLLAAGRVEKRFGGGKLLEPMQLIIGDRATFRLGGKEIPVGEIAVSTAKQWFKNNLRFVDPEKDVRYTMVLAEGSDELTDIFLRPGALRGSNDTSAAVGYFPLSPTERTVLDLEKHLNSMEFKERFPDTGEDVKVMGFRQGISLDITVAMPLLARLIYSEEEYFLRKELIQKEMTIFLNRIGISDFKEIVVHYNTLDQKGRGLGGVYLSLLGTSAEDADSGQVGRGNRVNGVISMNRPMGTEAAAGKNPVSHVGKIYNLLAHRIAKKIYETSEIIKEVYVLLLSRIGRPIDTPQVATAQILLEPGKRIKDVAPSAEAIIGEELQDINRFCLEIAEGKYQIC